MFVSIFARPLALASALSFACAASWAQAPNSAGQAAAANTMAYALVARPLDVTQQRIDRVTLDPKTLSPIGRTEVSAPRCARLHASAAGDLLCLSNNVMGKDRFEFSSPYAAIYPRSLGKATDTHAESGGSRISRARMSVDGKYQAWTYFVKGHNYMDAGSEQFSTLTQIRQSIAGKPAVLHNLEKWPLTHQGKRVTAPDLNFWGVSFNPKNTQQFLVTAFFKGKPYLASGDLVTQALTVIHEGVECPSYSPNGAHIAYKKRLSTTRWAPAVMVLSSKKSTVLSQVKESIDDQIDWLDDKTIVFEKINTPLIGQASVDLMRLNPFEANAAARVWIPNARSAALVLPAKP